MKSWRNYYTNDVLDYTQLNSVGGWLIFLIIRLVFSITSSIFGIVQAVKDFKTTYIVLYVFIFFIATATIILIFMKKNSCDSHTMLFQLLVCLIIFWHRMLQHL